MATPRRPLANFFRAHVPREIEDMSSIFSDGQLRQVGNSLRAADWSREDLTLLGQAGRDRLIGIRDSLRRGGDIITAIVEGRTELWLHDDQKSGWARGRVIYTHLQLNGLLASCADLEELDAIKAKGVDFYRKYFGDSVLVGWRGVLGVSVPYLLASRVEVVRLCNQLDDSFCANDGCLRRK